MKKESPKVKQLQKPPEILKVTAKYWVTVKDGRQFEVKLRSILGGKHTITVPVNEPPNKQKGMVVSDIEWLRIKGILNKKFEELIIPIQVKWKDQLAKKYAIEHGLDETKINPS